MNTAVLQRYVRLCQSAGQPVNVALILRRYGRTGACWWHERRVGSRAANGCVINAPLRARTIEMLHPLECVPAVAEVIGHYQGENGRRVGYKLEFPGGYVSYLTYREIVAYRKALEAWNHE